MPDDVDLVHNNRIDEKYYESLDQLNMKEEFIHVMNQTVQGSEKVRSALWSRKGKLTVTHAMY